MLTGVTSRVEEPGIRTIAGSALGLPVAEVYKRPLPVVLRRGVVGAPDARTELVAHYLNDFCVSVYTSPRPLGKRITSGPDGTVSKEPLGELSKGTVEVVQLRSLTDFATLRAGLTAKQALGYGVTGYKKARITTQAALGSMSPSDITANGLTTVARDAEHFHFAEGAGVLMIDHDPAPGAAALTGEQLREMLCEAMPELRGVTMLWASSAGSMIYDGDSEVIGLRGSRIYFVVSDARRIPEVGRLLFDRLVLAGHGRIVISGAGQSLHRGPIDASVWQPERLDFVRATCEGGLEQRPAKLQVFPGDGVELMIGDTLLDVATVAPLTDAEAVRLKAIWSQLSSAAKPEADRVRHEWAVARADADVTEARVPNNPEALAACIARYEGAARDLVLGLDHPLTLADGRVVAVADLRNDPAKFEGVRMSDPLEPEYGGNDRRIAVAYMQRNGGTDPAIYSHAHGGTWYKLRPCDEDFEASDELAPAMSPAPAIAPSQARRRFEVQSAAQFSAGPPPEWHIRGVLPKGELCVIFGESGSGKSFAVLDMVAAIATGKEWCGRPVTQGKVVYVVAEGRAGFRKRLDALKEYRGIDLTKIDLGIVADCPDLLHGDEEELAAAIKAAGGASLVVIDTLARVMAGGDENSGAEMSDVLAACKRIHEETSATVLLVHHSGKDRAKGARGWSGLRAAADAELEVIRSGTARRIRVSKQKDGEDSAEFAFELKVVVIDIDPEDLSNITSCVVNYLDARSPPPTTATVSRPKGKWKTLLLDELRRLGGGASRDSLVTAVLKAAPRGATRAGERDARKQSIERALAGLIEAGILLDRGDGEVRLMT